MYSSSIVSKCPTPPELSIPGSALFHKRGIANYCPETVQDFRSHGSKLEWAGKNYAMTRYSIQASDNTH